MELGLITFGTLLPDPHTGAEPSQHQRFRDVVSAAEAADQQGFSWFTIGEHHFGYRDIIPSPAVLLAAIAERTSTIRLASGTTLVTNRDPVLVAEDYAMVDQLSGGRLEVVAGGSFFAQAWTAFGQDPASRVARKREAVELLLRLWNEDEVTWTGQFRPPLDEVRLQPRIAQSRPPLWLSAGIGSESVQLAVDYGLPAVIGTIGRTPTDYVDTFADYRRRWRESGRTDPPGRLGAASHCFVARTSQAARALWTDYLNSYHTVKVPSLDTPLPALDLDAHLGPNGPTICGSPAEALDKLGRMHELWGHDLHLLTIDLGGIPYAEVAKATELVASEVLPHLSGLGTRQDEHPGAAPKAKAHADADTHTDTRTDAHADAHADADGASVRAVAADA